MEQEDFQLLTLANLFLESAETENATTWVAKKASREVSISRKDVNLEVPEEFDEIDFVCYLSTDWYRQSVHY